MSDPVEPATAELRDLREKEARYQQLFELIDEGICVADPVRDEAGRTVDFRVVETNAAFDAMSNTNGTAGRTTRSAIPAWESLWRQLQAWSNSNADPLRVEWHAPPVRDRWFELYATHIGEPGERRIVVVLRDIDTHKRHEQALRETDRRKDVFLATLAHELRNPLAPLRNGLSIMKLAAGDVRATGEAREMMERQLAHMVRLIDDLLDVSRISSGKIALRRERVRVDEIVRQAIELAKPAIEQAGVEFDVTNRAPEATVDGDPARLAQVLSNLLHNAAKFTLRGGHVELAITPMGRSVEIAVRDDGIGIPREMLGRIFDLFSQVDQSIERSQGGLGIGLSLSRGLIELHGGTISASSAGVSRGSEFVVRLPMATSQASSPTATKPQPAPPQKATTRVMVVDDNADAADSLGLMLELLGHEVRVVVEAGSALAAAEVWTPHIVLLDLGMPGLSGYDVCRQLRSRPFGAQLKIVALTGWGAEEDKRRTREAGFDAHLVKPVDADTISRILTNMGPDAR